MDNEIVSSLDLIADLLRQRLELEQQRQARHEAQRLEGLEQLKEFQRDMPKIEVPSYTNVDFDAKLEEDRQERRAFETALLAELRRQSEALEALARARG